MPGYSQRRPTSLPSFDIGGDGVVCLRRAFGPDWIDLLAEGVEIAMQDGVARDTRVAIAKPGEPGFFFYDAFMW